MGRGREASRIPAWEPARCSVFNWEGTDACQPNSLETSSWGSPPSVGGAGRRPGVVSAPVPAEEQQGGGVGLETPPCVGRSWLRAPQEDGAQGAANTSVNGENPGRTVGAFWESPLTAAFLPSQRLPPSAAHALLCQELLTNQLGRAGKLYLEHNAVPRRRIGSFSWQKSPRAAGGSCGKRPPHLPVRPLRGTAGSPSQHPWVQAPWGAGWGLPSHSHHGVAPSIFFSSSSSSSSAAEAPNNVLRLLPQESC